MNKKTKEILAKLKDALMQIYGGKLHGLFLYGSYARGDAGMGSDLDVAMILDDFKRPWYEIQRTSQIVSEFSLEYGITISLIPLRASDWSEKQKLLVRNIYREGIAV